MADIFIDGGIVLTMNPAWKIYPNGAVAVEGNRIIDVGEADALRKRHQAAKRVIRATNKLVMPGLVDSHTHLHYGLFKGLVPGNYGYGNPWIQRAGECYMHGQFTDERAYLSAMITCAESIRTGTTTCIDCGSPGGTEGSYVRAITDSGMRGILGVSAEDIFGPPGYIRPESNIKIHGATAEANIERIEGLIQKYHGKADGRVGIWPCLRQMQNVSDTLCRMAKGLADKYGIGMTCHANVMRPMVQKVVDAWGKTPIMRLYDNGALGENVLIAHAAHMLGDDIRAVLETKTTLSHCIFTSMGLAYGASLFNNFPAMHAMGINIAIGTDGAICCNHKDMVRVMDATFLVNKEGKFDCNLWPPKTVVEMATLNGAKGLNMAEEIGSLEQGKKADLILFDLNRPEWVPVNKYNLIENLVLSATGDSVETVMIDGKVVMEGYEFKTFKLNDLLAQVQKESEHYLEGLHFLGTEKPYPENMPPLW
jgi:cytosine/adenosine deaminase-related metal-dependent hydrolase